MELHIYSAVFSSIVHRIWARCSCWTVLFTRTHANLHGRRCECFSLHAPIIYRSAMESFSYRLLASSHYGVWSGSIIRCLAIALVTRIFLTSVWCSESRYSFFASYISPINIWCIGTFATLDVIHTKWHNSVHCKKDWFSLREPVPPNDPTNEIGAYKNRIWGKSAP